MPSLRAVLLSSLLPLATLHGQELAVLGLDPIALGRGEERAGLAEHALEHGPFRYLFADADSLATFRADPERHAIQLGGACARMGPLSGSGDPARWLVHDGRIFVFASDQCRDGFAKQPQRFLDPDAPRPEATAEGAALLQRAIAAHGGAERLRAFATYRYEWQRVDGDTTQVRRCFVALPDRLRTEQDYRRGDELWRYANVLAPDAAFTLSGDRQRPLAPAAQRELQRGQLLDPPLLLRRALAGNAVAAALGAATVGDVAVERLQLWLDGALLTLGVDADGRVRSLHCRGRGPQLWFGDLELTFVDFVDEAGLLVPRTVRATFDGKAAPGLDQDRTHIAVDAPLPADLFTAPK